MKSNKILVIDDDVDICKLLQMYLKKNNFETDAVYLGNTAKLKLKTNQYDLVLCDFRLPDIDGLEMIKFIKHLNPALPVIIITGYSDVKMAVKAIKRGAADYVTKPIHPEEILLSIKGALAKAKSNQSVNQEKTGGKTTKKETVSPQKTVPFVKGSSSKSKELYRLVDLVAPTDMSVIILGESGTGKEVMARNIHELSDRKGKKFVAVDCGALPKEIAGSELFGHKKGAFTGAVADKIGHFEEANGGTLFLDEIGNLSYENQIKLLRALQEKTIRPIGGTEDKSVDVRIIAATNDFLLEKVKKGDFREDLYYRLNEFKILIPPLRERINELSEFVDFMLMKSSEELQLSEKAKVSEEAMKAFEEYSWPGNIRELKNIIKRSVLLCKGKTITVDILPEVILKPEYYLSETIVNDETDFVEAGSLKDVVAAAEKKAIISALKKTAFNKSKTAKILQVDRKTLYNKMNAYGLE